MIVSGYTLDVYCDFGAGVHESKWTTVKDQFFDESKAVAWRQCRRAGWKVKKVDGVEKAMCPACVKAGAKWTDSEARLLG